MKKAKKAFFEKSQMPQKNGGESIFYTEARERKTMEKLEEKDISSGKKPKMHRKKEKWN